MLTQDQKAQFSALCSSIIEDHEEPYRSVCLVQVVRKSDRADVAVVCRVWETPDGTVNMEPLAEIIPPCFGIDLYEEPSGGAVVDLISGYDRREEPSC